MKCRQKLNFNTDWLFNDKNLDNAQNLEFDDQNWQRVNLPHSNKIVPHHYFDESIYQFVSWYRRHFHLAKEIKGKKIIIEFGGVMSVAELYVNGNYVGEHKGGYTSFSFDITDYINFGQENVLAVRVDSTMREDIPPEGNVVDYLLFGGIYREVNLKIVAPLYIEQIFYEINEANTTEGIVTPRIKFNNHYQQDQDIEMEISLLTKNNDQVIKKKESLTIEVGSKLKILGRLKLRNPELWGVDNPYLYFAICKIYKGSELIDCLKTKVGIRKVEFKDDGKFYLNNTPLKLRGLNRHQMFPYLGNAMPARGQRKDAEILKYKLGLNFVRSSHYPPAESFLKRCDEIGLLVFEEIPGWQHIGDQEWKQLSRQHLKEMIMRDRNHPSVFIWGVRINESDDDHDFYRDTNEIAHRMDPTRATGGVRNFRGSEFLEDVFTYNDFEYNREGGIKLPDHIPYMITEYMGHMYPTKSYDSVERLIKQAIKHAKIQDKQYGVPEIAGASGWCAFDYNTHQDFGSGDRICYHGVCDMFRLPKFAAYFYKSQQKPDDNPVLFIARYLTPSFNEEYGDRIVVFGNCEEVELYVGDEHVSTSKPNYVDYPNLPHPPFAFEGCKWWEWGGSTVGSITAIGKINSEEVARHSIYPFSDPERLTLTSDFKEIVADGADCTRVVVELKDENNQVLYLSHHPVFFKIRGPGKIIGENPFSLEAGRGVIFVQASRTPGKITLQAEVNDLSPNNITIKSTTLTEKIVPVIQ